MRLITYDAGNGPRAGVEVDSSIIDAWDLLGENGAGGLKGLLADDRLADLNTALENGDGRKIGSAGTQLLPPIPDPDKIICIGLNYRAHAEEAGQDLPKAPTIFGKYRNALVADGATVELPVASQKVDYEAEIAFVIGKRASNDSLEDATGHIAGYTLLNDLSARDLQFLTPQWMAGKVFDGSAPCGPAIVTVDEAGAPDTIGVSLDLNGERLQESSTDDLIFSMPELVSHLSGWMTLEPGDIISTGTPSGVGSVRDPRIWLKDGDELVVGSPQLGALRTKISRKS